MIKTKVTLEYKKVCLFWGVMDLFYVARFIWLNVEQGRIPLIDDIIGFSQLYSEQGMVSLVMFSLSLLLNISILFSAFLLLAGWRHVHKLIYAQIPLRLLFIVPSLSFMPWLVKEVHFTGVFTFVMVVIISELLKFGTFTLTKKDKNA